MGINTGINLDKAVVVGDWISNQLQKKNGSRAGSALTAVRNAATENKKVKSNDSSAKSSPVENSSVVESREGSTVTIRLNRPEMGNALSLGMIEGLTTTFQRLSTDHTVHNIILTGEGKHFCTGMDLTPSSYASSGVDTFEIMRNLFDVIDNCPKTTIALINGGCYGGGIGLAFVCDIRVSLHPKVTFTLTEVRRGFSPATISKYIVREWGAAMTRQAMLTAAPIKSQDLLRTGSLQAICESKVDADQYIEKLLQELNLAAPLARSKSKYLVKMATTGAREEIDANIKQTYREMMKPSAEAKYAVEEFRNGRRTVDWSDWYMQQANSTATA